MLSAGFAIEERPAGEGEDEASRMYLCHPGPLHDACKAEFLRYILLRFVQFFIEYEYIYSHRI